MLNINSAEQVHLGHTTRQTQLQGLVSNRAAFLNQHELHIANLSLGTNLSVNSQATLALTDPPPTQDCPTEPERDEVLFVFPDGSEGSRSVYQVINIKTGEVRELFTNGWGLYLSLDRANNGYRVVFFRDFVNGQVDLSTWIATLSY